MKLLVVCDQGENRSVTLAHLLKYVNGGVHDVLTAGLLRNSGPTLDMLLDWADVVIATTRNQQFALTESRMTDKAVCWELGPDVYRRPHNPELLAKCKALVAEREPGLRDLETAHG